MGKIDDFSLVKKLPKTFLENDDTINDFFNPEWKDKTADFQRDSEKLINALFDSIKSKNTGSLDSVSTGSSGDGPSSDGSQGDGSPGSSRDGSPGDGSDEPGGDGDNDDGDGGDIEPTEVDPHSEKPKEGLGGGGMDDPRGEKQKEADMAVSMEIINNTGDEAQSIVQGHQMATSVKIGQVEYNVTDPEIQKKLKKEAFDAFKLAKKVINSKLLILIGTSHLFASGLLTLSGDNERVIKSVFSNLFIKLSESEKEFLLGEGQTGGIFPKNQQKVRFFQKLLGLLLIEIVNFLVH